MVMAPMTRNRAIGNVPNDLMATYYAQRAGIGLIVTEGVSPSPNGLGYARIRGIFTAEHVKGWQKTTSAFHDRGGRIFVQLMHTGRASHVDNLPAGARVVSSVETPITAQLVTDTNGLQAASRPHALSEPEIAETVEEFATAARLAREAGFDGVEIHGANGYLLDQFAKDGTNKRTDAYGGSIENRARLMLEVAKIVAAEAGPERTGIRISPVTPANDISDSNPQAVFDHIVDHLSALKLVYLHVVEGATGGPRDIAPFDYGSLRKRFKGAYVANNGYDFELATKVLAADDADLIAFGKPFISNPDLVERLKKGAPLNEWDKATFYGGGAKGYTDYPTLEAAEAAQ